MAFSFTRLLIWICVALGAGGEEKPYLVNAANAITFGYVLIIILQSSKCTDVGLI